jgi:arsenite methyltransferase
MSDFYNAEMAAKQERMARTKDMVRQRAKLMQAVSPRAGEHILELGSGNGIFTAELLEAVGSTGKVVGLDSSIAIIETARHICPEGEFLHGDAQDLPFEDATFDVVVAAQLFCFLDDVDQAIAEAFRVLKPRGRLIILDTDWQTLIWRSGNPALMERVMKAYTAVYSNAHLPRTLPEQMAKAGFSDVDVDGFVVLNLNFAEDTYARQSAEFAVSIMSESQEFSSAEQMSWLADQERLNQESGFFFSLNRYLISASKPVTT